MKTNLFNSIIIIIMVVIGYSCSDNIDEINNESPKKMEYRDSNSYLKKEFAKALAKVLSENVEVRQILKEEALKKIDYDYDVLYAFIKNRQLSNRETIRNYMLKYIDDSMMRKIEKQIPTLTIFIPSLPEESFSAEKWDIYKDIPKVAIRIEESNAVPVIDAQEEEEIIESNEIPLYPVIVVKENERMVISNDLRARGLASYSVNDNMEQKFAFIDDVFNNMEDTSNEAQARSRIQESNDPVSKEQLQPVIDGYNILKSTGYWQRDYLYYNISPSHTKGPFNYKMKEHIVSFEMVGDPKYALAKIADQSGDPRIADYWRGGAPIRGAEERTGWTDGEFEFKVKIYLGSKSLIGSEMVTMFRASPKELFSFTTKNRNTSKIEVRDVFLLKKKLALPLFEWNLENISSSVKISIEEVDAVETVVNLTSTTAEFATNFGFDEQFGEVVKVGAKFGTSTKETKTVSYQVTTTYGNDELGEVIVNFADDVITKMDTTYTSVITYRDGRVEGGRMIITPNYNNKYSTGWYKLNIAPLLIN